MLGLARASQWAGWWTAGAEPEARDMTVTFAVTAQGIPSPRYAADFTLVDPPPNFGTITQYAQDTDGANINVSGIGTQSVSTTVATTFRVGQDWLNPSLDYYSTPWNSYDTFGNAVSATSVFFNVGIQTDPGQIKLHGYSAPGYDVGNAWPAEWRDRWLTLICSSSNNSADFNNWTAGSNEYDIYQRVCLVDTVTGEILVQHDDDQTFTDWNNTIEFDQPWNMAFDSTYGNYYYGAFISGVSDDWAAGNLQDIQIATQWKSFGSMVDPVGNTQYLASFSPPTDIAGVTAWARLISRDTGTALNNGNVDYAYSANVVNQGQRLPDYDWFIGTDFSTAVQAPVFTSIT